MIIIKNPTLIDFLVSTRLKSSSPISYKCGMPACLCSIRSREVRSVWTLRRTVCVYNTERKNLYFKKKKLKSLYGETIVQRKIYIMEEMLYIFLYIAHLKIFCCSPGISGFNIESIKTYINMYLSHISNGGSAMSGGGSSVYRVHPILKCMPV